MLYSFAKEATMKINTQNKYESLGLNTASLTGVSLLWGQMLGLLNLYFTPLTVLILLLGYGSEVKYRHEVDTTTKNSFK